MDDILKVEFPIGDQGVTLVLSRPTDAQLFVLALTRQPKTDDEKMKAVQRIVRVLETLSGDQWADVVEEGMITGTLTPLDLLGVVNDVIKFPWAEHAKTAEAEAALDSTAVEPEPVRPAPRVVSGG